MAWGQGGKSFKDVWGVEEEEMKSMITGTKELPSKITELEGKMVSKEEFQTVSNTLTSINEQLVKINKPPENNGNGNNGGGEGGEGEPADWGTDPDRAFREGMRPVAGVALTAQAFAVRTDVFSDSDKYKYYPALKKEIDDYIKKQPLNMQINPEVIANCYKVILAENMDKIVQDNDKKEGKFYLESGRSNTNTSDIVDKSKLPPEQQLSEKELAVCKKMNITPAGYLEQKQKMVVV
jgi:hypothetical protein